MNRKDAVETMNMSARFNRQSGWIATAEAVALGGIAVTAALVGEPGAALIVGAGSGFLANEAIHSFNRARERETAFNESRSSDSHSS